MLTSSDWGRMQNDLAEVRGDNAVSVALRRGNVVLAAQEVRVARIPRAAVLVGREVSATALSITVLGPVGMDVQAGDRFTVGGLVYVVEAVRPNGRAATMVEARAVQ